MAAVDSIRNELKGVEDELAGLESRRKALEQAAEGLRTAIKALDGKKPGRGRGRSSSSRSSGGAAKTARPDRPKIEVSDLVGAVRELGGRASVEQLVDKLNIPDGRSLNGARRVAVDNEQITYADRTYALPSSDPRWPDEDGSDDTTAE